ncbi:unnamed protein product [Heligmosomoides polygyrus]|uniref:Uncharacterized protein n=1 Tax=Heligmosomoides polygyrus TaxID=6339 RepID=A0A3P8DDI3_HELPZ|nr:unnamed protein product [Heligmosomoides polygyrus]
MEISIEDVGALDRAYADDDVIEIGYVYLGRQVNMANDLVQDLDSKIRAAWSVLKSVEEVVKKTKNVRLLVHLLSCTVLPVLTYDSKT